VSKVTFFEYLAIAYSLVLSIAVTRVLGGLSAALFGEGRYWIHLAWVVHVLGSSLIVFWNFWMYRDIEWTLPRFMLVLASPALLLVQATQIIPVDPSKVESWRDYFLATHKRLYATIATWIVIVSLSSSVILTIPLFSPFRLVSASMFLLFLYGIWSQRTAVHGLIVVANIAGMLFMMLFIFALPGGLTAAAR
jgi:hypothetical protein